MLLITERRKLGSICGHEVYAVAKSEMIPLSNYTVWSNMVNSKVENRFLFDLLVYKSVVFTAFPTICTDRKTLMWKLYSWSLHVFEMWSGSNFTSTFPSVPLTHSRVVIRNKLHMIYFGCYPLVNELTVLSCLVSL